MLIGHTGAGKTSLIEQVAARAQHGVVRSNMNGQTTVGDFVGFWTVKGGETMWVDGVLPTAMREGLWLIVDEIDFAEPSILAALTAVLEPHGRLTLKEKGNEVVAPHPAFRLFATANAVGAMSQFRHLYQGANLMNEAFLDRWRVYLLDYLSPARRSRRADAHARAAYDTRRWPQRSPRSPPIAARRSRARTFERILHPPAARLGRTDAAHRRPRARGRPRDLCESQPRRCRADPRHHSASHRSSPGERDARGDATPETLSSSRARQDRARPDGAIWRDVAFSPRRAARRARADRDSRL